jgi:DNA-binding winged helix-turn-helix (wHTH) protein
VRLGFADCVFDSDTREVSRAGRALDLSPKAFALLELLIRERPKAVSRDRIQQHLWPKVFVSDASMSNLVAELRAALGDDAQEPRILRTVRRFGYAFSAEGRAAAPTSARAYRLIWERREIDLAEGDNVFGREHAAAVWVDDPSVSRNHARIVVDSRGATLEDLGSKNGTFLNGTPVREPVCLSDGDAVQVGRAAMTFHVLEQTGSTQTVSGLKPPGKTAGTKR